LQPIKEIVVTEEEQEYRDEVDEILAEGQSILESVIDTGDGRVVNVKYLNGRIDKWLADLNKFEEKWGK
jgi:shikimate kinase